MYVPIGLLGRHVKESNAIENIRDHSGFWVQSHVAAARAVVHAAQEREILHPSRIHRLLTNNTPLEDWGGVYRPDIYGNAKSRMWVGGHLCPKARYVPEFMSWLDELIQKYQKAQKTKEEYASDAVLIHTIFLCIHPFIDGNGRTARLLLNALRLRHGLPWLVIEFAKRQTYYARIRAVHMQFEKEFPYMY